jgi:hypothetical protein
LTPDLITQVRAYAEHIDALAAPLDRLTPHQSIPTAPAGFAPARRGWSIALAAAAAVLVLVGGAVWLLRVAGSSVPPADQPAPIQQPLDGPPSIAPVQPNPRAYSLVRDPAYVGVKFFDQSAVPYNAYPEFDGWVSVGPNPVGNEHGSMQVYRRTTESGREDLLVMYAGPDHEGVDGLRLTGDTRDVYLVLSCSSEAALLMPGSTATPIADIDQALRAWRPGADGSIVEFEPIAGPVDESC